MEPPIFLTALLLLFKGCEVLTQRGEYAKQFSPTLCATSYLTPTGQFSIPAIIKPLFPTVEPTSAPEIVPSYPDYGNNPCMPQSTPMPPIIITRDNDDDWYHLLYFLILALSKNRGGGDCCYSNGNGGFGGNFGYGGNGFGGNGCGGNGFGGNGYGGNGYGGNGYGGYDCGGGYGYDEVGDYDDSANYGGKDTVYVPYPIAVPVNFPSSFPWFSNPDSIPPTPDFYPSPESEAPPCNCDCKDPNEVINVIIKTVE